MIKKDFNPFYPPPLNPLPPGEREISFFKFIRTGNVKPLPLPPEAKALSGRDTGKRIGDTTVKPKADLFIENAETVITCNGAGPDQLGCIRSGAVAIAGETILAVGTGAEVDALIDRSSARILDASGKTVAPGFVDCHTHLVFGKSRAEEFALRMTLSSDRINSLDMPVGIPASIRMTRETGEEELFHSALDRLGRMLRCGTTTVESKSGYGIAWPHELKMLRVNQRLQTAQPVDIVGTFLGAHDFPPEIDRNKPDERKGYIQTLIDEMIPRVAGEGLAEFCDIYCDDGYYTVDESRRILEAGMRQGLRAKIHTDAYANIGGSGLAAELPAISADHLNYTSVAEMEAMAKAGVVAAVLPALDFAVAHPKPFDPRAMIDAGLTLALGTNLNPGNWTESMPFVLQLACRNHGLSPQEAFFAATTGAAKAIGREKQIGSLEAGKLADIQIWHLPGLNEVIYRLGHNAVETVIKRGRIVHTGDPA